MDWGLIADRRRAQIESGADVSYREVFLPTFRSILESLSPRTVLDVGSGTGHLAADLIDLCGQLTLIEPDERSFFLAKEVFGGHQFEAFCMPLDMFVKSGKQFDLVIVHMVLHLIEDADEFLNDLFKCVRPGGCCTVSLPHPCFSERFASIDGYRYLDKCDGYVPFRLESIDEYMGIDLHMFHRPLSSYIKCVNQSGFVVRGLWEPRPTYVPNKPRHGVPRYLFVDLVKPEVGLISSMRLSPLEAIDSGSV